MIPKTRLYLFSVKDDLTCFFHGIFSSTRREYMYIWFYLFSKIPPLKFWVSYSFRFLFSPHLMGNKNVHNLCIHFLTPTYMYIYQIRVQYGKTRTAFLISFTGGSGVRRGCVSARGRRWNWNCEASSAVCRYGGITSPATISLRPYRVAEQEESPFCVVRGATGGRAGGWRGQTEVGWHTSAHTHTHLHTFMQKEERPASVAFRSNKSLLFGESERETRAYTSQSRVRGGSRGCRDRPSWKTSLSNVFQFPFRPAARPSRADGAHVSASLAAFASGARTGCTRNVFARQNSITTSRHGTPLRVRYEWGTIGTDSVDIR